VNGVFDAPRRILNAIEGLDFREMARVREYAYCCGGGGGAPLARPEMSGAAARNRIQEARDTEAEILVTACHQCVGNLRRFQEGAAKLPVTDIIDLVCEAANL
jgi:Fe-S oxidoreductase